MSDVEQLVMQAREIHAKAMNCSDFAEEGQWSAAEDVIDPPLHNYWRVTAIRRPHQKGVGPYPVVKALTQEPAVAGLLTFCSTALPQLCDLVQRLISERDEAQAALAVVRQSLIEQAEARADPAMPLLTVEVVDRLRSQSEASHALAETSEDRVDAHGLSLLCDWQDRARSTGPV